MPTIEISADEMLAKYNNDAGMALMRLQEMIEQDPAGNMSFSHARAALIGIVNIRETRRRAAEANRDPPPAPRAPTSAEIAASVAHLIDTAVVEAAHAAWQVTIKRQAENETAIAEARNDLATAITKRTELVRSAARGVTVTPRDMSKAEYRVRDAEAHMANLQDLKRELAVVWREGHDARNVARGVSYVPVLDHGIDLRIAAAARLDVARAELAAAERDWKIGCDVVLLAMQNGVPIAPQIKAGAGTAPQPEWRERAVWGRPERKVN